MESALAALKEVICQTAAPSSDGCEHEPSPTEIFALICSLLASGSGGLDPYVLMDILAAVTPHSATNIVRLQFRHSVMSILNVLKNSSEVSHICTCLKALSCIVDMQDTTIWETVYALQSINALLLYIDHSSSRIRKIVFDTLQSLLFAHASKNAKQLRSYLGEFCKEVLRACTRSQYKRPLQVVSFLEMGNAFLLPNDSVSLCEIMMKLHNSEQPVLTAAAYKAIDCFFQSASYRLAEDQSHHLLKTLMHSLPRSADMEANSYYFTALASGFVRLSRDNMDKALTLLPGIATICVNGSEAEFTQVHCAVATALKRIVASIPDSRLCERGPISKFLSALEAVVELRYQESWLYMLDVVRALLIRLPGDRGVAALGALVRKLASLYDAVAAGKVQVSGSNQVHVFDTLGYALRYMGVVRLLTLAPFAEARGPSPFSDTRDWLLLLVQSNAKLMPCRLSDFVDAVLPTARKCAMAAMATDSSSAMVARVTQLWALLPGFCYYGPLDIAEALPKLVNSFEKGLSDPMFPDIAKSILIAVTYLINSAKARSPSVPADVEALVAAANTLFPATLKIIESLEPGDGKNSACIQCIEALSSVAAPQLVAAVSKKLVEMLLASTGSKEDSEASHSWLSILLALVPYLQGSLVIIIYRTVRPLLSLKESSQKKAYLVFDALLKHHAAVVETYEPRMQVLAVLAQYLLTCGVNARHMRLRCIATLVSTLESGDDVLKACSAVLCEILLCQRDGNKKCRDNAAEVMETLVKKVPFDSMAAQLTSALSSDNAHLKAAAVNACCLLVLSRRDEYFAQRFADETLPLVLAILSDENGEETKAVLNYLRVVVSVVAVDILEGLVPYVIDAVTRCTGPLKLKYATQVRGILRKLIRRVDDSVMRPHMYADDVPLLDYIMRQDRRSKKKSEQTERDRMDRIIGSDSDSESEDDAPVAPRKRVKAIRAASTDEKGFPSTLSALLNEQNDSYSLKRGAADSVTDHSRKRRSDAMEESTQENEEYRVVVDAAGRVVVERAVQEAVNEAGKDTAQEPEKKGTSSDIGKGPKRVRELGSEYRSKKGAGGDVWKRGQLEPHAYIPLDPKMFSKKNNRETLTQLGSVLLNRNKRSRGGTIGKARGVTGTRNQRIAARKHAALKRTAGS